MGNSGTLVVKSIKLNQRNKSCKAVEHKGLLEAGDIDEALTAAAAVGDDTIQRRTQGYVVPESFNHGTSDQRERWFKRGYADGTLDACDTFGANQL